MSFDRDFFDMMPQSLTYQAYVSISTDGYGSLYHGSTSGAKTVKGRIQAIRSDIRTTISRENVPTGVGIATYKVIMAPWSTAGTSDTITVSPMDKITLPSGFLVAGSCSPPILKAYPVQDEDGHHHNEVWF